MWILKGFPLENLLLIFVVGIITNVINVDGEPEPAPKPRPGTIYYRKPSKLVFYTKYPPVFVYPKKTDDEYPKEKDLPDTGTNLASNDVDGSNAHNAETQHANGGKYFLLNTKFLAHLMEQEENYYLQKEEPLYDNWLMRLFGIRSKNRKRITLPSNYAHLNNKLIVPVYNYHPHKPLNTIAPQHQHHQAINNVKPVAEHIEGDIKYDFRTKTHSYDR